MGTVLAITNQKGGVGKTTTSLALATGLARTGKKVLAVDLDPQANLSFCLGGYSDDSLTVYELLKGEARPDEVILKREELDLVPSNILLSGIELEYTRPGREYLLKNALETLRDSYDYVVLDTPPALGILTVNAFAAADYLVIPMLADIFSLQGIAQLSDTIQRLKQICNPDLVVGGILLSKFDSRTVLGQRIKETAQMVAEQVGTRVYETAIRTSVALQEAQTNQMSIYEYAPANPAVKDFDSFVQELLADGI